jgi:small-conductance mechanosensitive channel
LNASVLSRKKYPSLEKLKYECCFFVSLFWFCSGTLVFGLACNDIASEVVSGLLLAAQRPFDEGDYILYGDDQSKGKVEKVGTMYTLIKGK